MRLDNFDRKPSHRLDRRVHGRTGHFDLENGYTNTTTIGTSGGSNANYPQSLLRIGTADPHLDFEFGFPSYETSSVGQPRVTGASDVSFASKYELGYSSNADWGVYGAITYPTGSKAFTAGNAQFTGDFNWGYTINSEFSLAGTLSFNALSGANSAGAAQSYFAFIPSLELTAALPGGPSQISAEYAYFSAAGPGLSVEKSHRLRLSARFRESRPVRRRVRLLADGHQRAEAALRRRRPFVHDLAENRLPVAKGVVGALFLS